MPQKDVTVDYRRPIETNSRIEENVARRHRKEDWFDSLLHQPLRERPHRALDCNSRKIRPRIGSSDVRVVLRRRRTAHGKSVAHEDGRLGQHRDRCSHVGKDSAAVWTHQQSRSEAVAVHGWKDGSHETISEVCLGSIPRLRLIETLDYDAQTENRTSSYEITNARAFGSSY